MKEFTHIFTNIAVIIGIVFVYLELNQNAEFAIGQAIGDSFTMGRDRGAGELGENAAPILAKAMVEPEALTLEERIVVHGHHAMVLDEITYLFHTWNSIFPITDWRIAPKNLIAVHLAYPYGRFWWRQVRDGVPIPEVRELVDEVLAARPDARIEFFDALAVEPTD